MSGTYLFRCFLCLPALALTFSSSYALEDDEWLGASYRPFLLSLNYFKDGDEQMWRTDFSAGLANFSELSFFYSDYAEINDNAGFSAWRAAWSSDPYANWGGGLAYSFRGSRNNIEIDELQLSAFHYFDKIKLRLQYKQADIAVFTRDRVIRNFDFPESAELKRNTFALDLSRSYSDWGWQFQAAVLDYDKDVARALNSRLFLRAFDELVLSQLLGLSEWQWSAALNRRFGKTGLTVGFQQAQQVVDASKQNVVDVSLSYAFSEGFSTELGLWYEFEDRQTPVNLGLVWQW